MPPKPAPRVPAQGPASPLPPIAGVSTSTTAFVGPTAKGPVKAAPALLTSYTDFERIYGGTGDLGFTPHLNYMAHGARAYFAEGGQRLYVVRVAHPAKSATTVPTLADYQRAFTLLEKLPDVSIVAAPGHTQFPAALADGVRGALVAHAQKLADRIAVLDVPAGLSVAGAQACRAGVDSKFAALYYPWVVTANPNYKPATPSSPPELNLPPSAFVCGIYAGTDATRGVSKAPANEPIQSALRLERALTNTEQQSLNNLGVNCLRFFVGRGNLVWGARTTSSDPEWKYVSVSRYFAYLGHSIAQGLQWVVSEPNAEPLWARVRTLVTNFLQREWTSGTLQGSTPHQAFYVKCDVTTMTQADIANGRLICEVGVALLRPAEFIVFRIGQPTADATPYMSRATPYQGFNFVVILSGVEFGGFADASGISSSTDIAEHREVRPPKPSVRKISGVYKIGDVTLKRGLVNAGEFSAWLKSSQDQAKRDVIILLQDEKGAQVRRWTLRQARPLKHTGPTLSAKGTDVAVEELVLSCEGIESD